MKTVRVSFAPLRWCARPCVVSRQTADGGCARRGDRSKSVKTPAKVNKRKQTIALTTSQYYHVYVIPGP